ncbi:TonB-dependent receptor [Oscillatoria amoena NRMC-F 0135]|nr:TonB-dependent receptor [Oscillatoria amoena NRMC-F 0135]
MRNSVLVLITLFLSMEAWSQVGTIKGKVTDNLTGERLPGATVKVANSTTGTVTDLQGEFFLRVKAGTVLLEVSYIGFQSIEYTVDVTSNAVSAVEISLTSDITELENVVITGVLQGQQRALNQQKTADNIKSIVSADQIGRFPDPNVAEALQRVPGVNIERDQGEGRYVLVRGLAPQFTNISINGEQIPSPEPGVRFVALDAIPADQLASMEVTKAITPDMDGDAVGGNVNLITRTAQSETPTIRASLLAGYNNIVKRYNGQGSLEYSQRFLNNKLGVMLNTSYYETDRGSDNWERDDEEMELRLYELVRTRLGLSSTIDYKFNTKNEIYFRSIYNRFTDRELRSRYIFVPNVDNSPFEDNEIERLTKDRLEKQIVSSFNFGGKHLFNKINLDYELAYSEAVQDTPFDIELGFVGEVDGLSIDFESNPEYPVFTVTNDVPYTDNSLYEFDEAAFGSTYALDINKTAKINIGIPFKAGANDGLLKFGGKVRFKEKSFRVTEDVFSWEGGETPTLDQFEGGPADGNFLGRYSFSPGADVEKFIPFFNANRNAFELNVEDKLSAEAVESYKATEDVYATYLMARIQFNKLMLLGGFRYELTKVGYNFNTVVYDFDGDLDEIVPEMGETDYSFLLPQVHARYAINSNTNIRAAFTQSYSRPNFESIVPSQEIDFSGREATIGNPELKPVGATNFDLLGEHYFGTVGVLSGGVFYKKLSDFIFNRRFDATLDGIDLTVNQWQNGESADLFGFELAYQQNLTFLPGVLNGLSVYANYTYTTSNASIEGRGDVRLPGQASNVGNFALGYETRRLNVRLALNFNGEYISEVGEESDEDFFVKSRVQFDATATYTINPRIRLFAEFLNLTNQPFEVYQGRKDQYVQREFYSWWSRVGVKVDIN